MSNFKKRISHYIDYKGIKKSSFYNETGISRSTLDKKTGLTEDNIAKFFATYPEVSPRWLITGYGDMIINNKNTIKKNKNKGIPLIPTSAIAGFGEGAVTIMENDIMEMYEVPEFSSADFMIHVKGSSMYPKYNSGDVVACKFINHRNFIQWNKVHVLCTRDQGTIIKRLKKSNNEDCFLAVSDNKDYDAFEIPKDEITQIALVMGVIRLE